MIWKQELSIEILNHQSKDTLTENLGIEFTEKGDNFIRGRMPVDSRTVQPFRILHGGASVALAETLGSVASMMCLEDLSTQAAVGLEINANHLSSITSGYVIGTCTPIRIGRNIHVWNIEIKDESEKLICVSRLTIAVVARRS